MTTQDVSDLRYDWSLFVHPFIYPSQPLNYHILRSEKSIIFLVVPQFQD